MAIETKSMHITPVGGNVFADLGFEPEEAAALKAESQRIISESTEVGAGCADVLLTIAEVATRLRVSRPVASMLCDAGKLGDVVEDCGGHRRVRASAIDAYRVVHSKLTDDAQSPREAGADAGLYEYPECQFQKRTAADLLVEMPDGLPRVPGWDEMLDVGLELPRAFECRKNT